MEWLKQRAKMGENKDETEYEGIGEWLYRERY